MDKLLFLVQSFLQAYGVSFLVMVFIGFGIAFIVELGVKKAFAWLEEKLAGREKLLALLDMIKMAAIFVVTLGLAAISTAIIIKGELPLPGNKYMAPFWFLFIYIFQYIFSMYGIKGILKLKDRPKKEKAPKEKKVNPVEGYTKISRNCFKDPATGLFFNKKGEQL